MIKLSNVKIEEIKSRRRLGETVNKIAVGMGLSYPTVVKYIRDVKIRDVKKRPDPSEWSDMIE